MGYTASYQTAIAGYDLLVNFQAGLGSKAIFIGDARECRFCGKSGQANFRKQAHTIPEGLGNKWLFSLDECDECNSLFSPYESSLCSSVGPILTLGGTKGKGNRVRQSGRSKGSHNVKHLIDDGQRRISFHILGEAENIQPPIGTSISFQTDGRMTFDVPPPAEKFVARHAYKALAKIGLALLPRDDLCNFEQLKNWIQEPNDHQLFPFLDVGIAVGSLGNAPPYISATILRRRGSNARQPSTILLLTAGSVCWQMDLMPDELDDHCGPARFGSININWTAELHAPDEQPVKIPYGPPTHFDWSSKVVQEIPVARLITHFNQNTLATSIELSWREMLPSG